MTAEFLRSMRLTGARGGPPDHAKQAQAAIAEAFDCEIPFAEMLVRRDFIESGACPEDERATQIIALGGAISRMVLPPSEYAAVLGGGIDPEEAAAAFEAAKGG